MYCAHFFLVIPNYYFLQTAYIYKQDFLYLHDNNLHGTSHHQTSELDQFW